MVVLVTGRAGLMGSHLVEELLERGVRGKTFSRGEDGHTRLIGTGWRRMYGQKGREIEVWSTPEDEIAQWPETLLSCTLRRIVAP